MCNKPLVSIVLTLYKIDPTYLDECINSLLNQTYENIDIMCMDDCSPMYDYTYLKEKSPKIRYFRNKQNLGMNKTVNKAFNFVRGKYVVRLGSDDWFDPTLIEKEVAFLEEHSNYGAVCCELQRFGNYDNRILRPIEWDRKDILLNRNFGGTGYAGGMMFRRNLIGRCYIDESLRMCEDFDFHMQLLRYMPIGSIHEALYHYRAHDESLCAQVKRQERLSLIDKIVEKHKKFL